MSENKRRAYVFSPAGSTLKLMTAAAKGMDARLVDVTVNGCSEQFEQGDLLLFGVPDFGGRVPEICLQRISQLQGGGAYAGILVSYGNRAVEDAFLEMSDALTAAGFVVLGGGEFVTRHSIIPAIASGRPNQQDLAQAQQFGTQLAQKAAEEDPVPAALPGNRPYRKRSVMTIHPAVSAACVGCGTCAANCPVGAIPKEDPALTDPDKCITCMRCVTLCPTGARALTDDAHAAMSAKLCRVCAGEKQNKIYL